MVFVNPNGIVAAGINKTGIIASAAAAAHTVPDSRVNGSFCSIVKYYSNSHTRVIRTIIALS
jgi:hypothetical protein